MTSCSVTSWNILCFQATQTLQPTCLFTLMCLFIVCERMFHEQFPVQITSNNKHIKCVEILAGEDFPPKLLWRTPKKQNFRLQFSKHLLPQNHPK